MPLLKIETVPALDRLRWEDLEFKSSLGYVMRQRKKEGEGKKEERWERGGEQTTGSFHTWFRYSTVAAGCQLGSII